MNFTLDDSSPQLSYLPDAWGVQSPSDPARQSFFYQTFHAAQLDGASVNMSLVGSAVYLYGSKGPNHANYSVQYDGDIVFLSAFADELQYQQLLFHTSFDTSPPHFVSLKVQLNDQNTWLDLDFVTITDTSNPVNAIEPPTNTVIPPWFSISSSSSPASATSATSTVSIEANSHSHAVVSEALSITFGSLIAIAAGVAIAYFSLRKLYDRRRAREHAFRQSTRAASQGAGGGVETTRLQAQWATVNASSTLLSTSESPKSATLSSEPLSPGPPKSVTGTAVSAGQASETSTKISAASAPLAFLSTVPSSFNFKGGRAHKGDADSMKTDFLQV